MTLDTLDAHAALPAEARDALRSELRRVWQDVLEVPTLDPADDFFDLGGHSLMAIDLRSRVRRLLNAPQLRVDPLRTPTVASMADAILVELGVAAPGAMP